MTASQDRGQGGAPQARSASEGKSFPSLALRACVLAPDLRNGQLAPPPLCRALLDRQFRGGVVATNGASGGEARAEHERALVPPDGQGRPHAAGVAEAHEASINPAGAPEAGTGFAALGLDRRLVATLAGMKLA